MNAPQQAPPQQLDLGDNMRLCQVDGRIVLIHPKLAEPFCVETQKLQRWLLRLLREEVL